MKTQMSLTRQERHKRAWEVIEYHEKELWKSCVDEYFNRDIWETSDSVNSMETGDESPTVMEAISDTPVVTSVSTSHMRARISVTFVKIIRTTAVLGPKLKLRKNTVLQLIEDAAPLLMPRGKFEQPAWYHFQCNMKAIDFLAAPDMFGDAIYGLVLLFPDTFNWSRRGKLGVDSNEKMKTAVAQAMTNLPKLLTLAQALTPQAKKLAVDINMSMLPSENDPASSIGLPESLNPRLREGIIAYLQNLPPTAQGVFEIGLGANSPTPLGPPFPTETNPASSSGRLRSLAPRPREGTVAHPQHPPLPARAAFEFGLAANKPSPFGPPLPTVENTPLPSRSTAMDIDSVLI